MDDPRDEPADAGVVERAADTSHDTADWSKIANLYWLGHDVLATTVAASGGDEKSLIVRGLRQSKHHCDELGLATTSMGINLARLYDEATATMESDWDQSRRRRLVRDLRTIKNELGALASLEQQNFRSHPK